MADNGVYIGQRSNEETELWFLCNDKLEAATAVIDALPILGVGTVLIPWSLFSLLTGSFRKGLMLILTYIFILCVRNTLEPRAVGEKIGLNPFVTLLSMFIGFRLGGFFGLAFIPIAVLSILELQKLGYISLWEDHADYK